MSEAASSTGDGTAGMLARYKAWANERMCEAVAGLLPGEATKDRPSLFPPWFTR